MTSILDQVNAYYIKTQERIDFLGKEMQDAPCGSLRIRTRSGNKAYYDPTSRESYPNAIFRLLTKTPLRLWQENDMPVMCCRI